MISKKRGSRNKIIDARDVELVLKKVRVNNLYELEEVQSEILARILSYLTHAELLLMCRVSNHVRNTCKKFKLHERLHTNQTFSLVYDSLKKTHRWISRLGFSDDIRVLQIEATEDLIYTLMDTGKIAVWRRDADDAPFYFFGFAEPPPTGEYRVVSFSCHQKLAVLYAVTESGRLFSWNVFNSFYIDFPDDPDVIIKSVVCCKEYSYGGFRAALTSKGKVYTWGANIKGSLGRGRDVDTTTQPVLVDLPEFITSIACCQSFGVTMAIGESGSLYGWGQVGTGLSSQWNPIKIGGDMLKFVESIWCANDG